MIKNESYIVIQGFMINELKLKGNDLIVYAIIYGFSQLKGQKFNGSLQYLAKWTNSSKQGVLKNLKSLLNQKLIAKEEKFINGVKFVEYYATELNGVCNSVSQGMQLSCTNNIDIEEEKEKVIEFYNNNFGLITPYIAEDIFLFLDDGIEKELIIKAMKEAIDNNARKWKYVKAILNDCLNNKIHTLKQYEIKQKEFKNKKTNKTPPKKEVTYNTDFSEYDKYVKRD